jgi:signal transduction histidine kinase
MADELVASLRQIIWAMNSPSTTVKQLVDYLVDFAHLYCAQHGLSLHAESDSDWPAISLQPEQRRNPFLALKESLHNTVKHSGADRVDLSITWDNALVIDVRDNGKGTIADPDQLPGNGLRTMKRRISAIGGKVLLDGTQGMRVLIRLPMPPRSGN